MTQQGKRILSAILAAVFVLSVFTFTPVMANTTTNYEWTTKSSNENTKFYASPKNGTFTIESSVKDAYSYFTRRLQVKSGETYMFTAEVQVSGFNEVNQQATFSIAYADDSNPNFETVRIYGKDVADTSVWLPISCTITTVNDKDLYISLFAYGEGKAIFRNVKFEKASFNPIDNSVTVSQNNMTKRDYDVKKDTEWTQTARNINVKDFNFPNAIGKTTLSYDSAFALVGKSPEEIAEKVKTVGDVLQYMVASRFGHGSPSEADSNREQELRIGNDDSWGFDPHGKEQLIAGYSCCCGGMANTVSYLLNGDYNKVGSLQWQGESHVINWVLIGETYYFFDFIAIHDSGNYGILNYPITMLDKLEDFYDNFPDWYSQYWDYDSNTVINAVYAYESSGTLYPHWWGDLDNTPVTLPTFAEEKVTIIYEKNVGKSIAYKTLSLPSSYNYWGLSTIPQSNVNIPLGEIRFAQNANVTILDQISIAPLTPQTVTPTASTVYINGKATAFEAYNINGNNFFKLRDLAMVLNGTQKQFDVGYNNDTKAITMTSNKPYTITGGELSQGDGKEKTATPTESKIYLDGKELNLTVYNINGNNFFKLRDLMKAIDVFVGYDNNTRAITVDTSKGYVE